MLPTRVAVVAIVLLLVSLPVRASVEPEEDWATHAEASDYRATPSYAETMEFLRRLERRSPRIQLATFGRSPQGRDLPLVIVSGEGAFTPEAAHRLGKPIVLIQNGIHSGEIDGKDACLALLRDLATGRRPDFGQGVTLLIVPIYNVDGHERTSPHNRPNQNGPVEGMGFRTTAAGYDLNRDHLKLESMEARALIELVNRWRPHLHVDDHVTNGSDHAWVFTWSWGEAPQLAAPVAGWLAEHMGSVLDAVEAAGYRTGPYVGLIDRNDPAKGFSSWVGEPRYSGGYFALRHRPSILVEMHAYKPYRQRVLALTEFLAALVERAGASGRQLVEAVAAAEAATVALGAADAESSEVVVAWESHDTGDTIRWPVYDWSFEPSLALGVPILTFDRGKIRGSDPAGIEVPWIHAGRAAETAPRPRGYLVEPGWPQIEERLTAHGLVTARLKEAVELELEVYRLEDPVFAEAPYQGRHRLDEVSLARVTETVSVPAGTLWVPANQPDFEVAAQLLEPEAPDSLVSWGLTSTVFEPKEYIDPRVLEPIVQELLQDDEVRARWEEALEDESFAADPRARWMWWYRQTVYWDDTVGRWPALRVMGVTPELSNRVRRPESARAGRP
ncbi:MAG: M14 family metallopeptidase [bacterium]|nr:M14 family metallopeptidase [bacterium]